MLKILIIFLTLFFTYQLNADGGELDLTNQETQYSKKNFLFKKKKPVANSEIPKKKFFFKKSKKKQSKLLAKKSNLQLKETSKKKLFKSKKKTFGKKEHKENKQFGLNNKNKKYSQSRKPEKSLKYSNAPIANVKANHKSTEQLINQLSLQDINRYAFRKNRPSKPGFPNVKAGGKN